MVGSLEFSFRIPIVQLVLEHYLGIHLCTYNPNQTTTFINHFRWYLTSSAPGIATVNASTGLVTGIAAGTATITYTGYR
jgi:hypothetical protein